MSTRPDWAELLVKQVGEPTALGVITGNNAAKNNSDTAVPFSATSPADLRGKVLMVQSDVAVHLKSGTANTVTATASATGTSWQILANERVLITMGPTSGFLSAFAAVAYNVKVFEVG